MGTEEDLIFSLSIHADYKCRHSGRRCSTDWDVPIELPVYRSLAEAVSAGRLRTSGDAAGLAPFVVSGDLPEDTGAIFERTEEGTCVFFERGPNLCIVHRDLGEPALPLTCRHFPRLSVQDGRGTFVTLSHFCPTAASLLFREDVPVEIVAEPPAFPLRDYDGLRVSADDFPPLLRPRMLMDSESYSAWERHMVRRCAGVDRLPESVIGTLERDAGVLRRWRPGRGTLVEAVAALPEAYLDATSPETLAGTWPHHAEVMRAIPEEFLPEPDTKGLEDAFRTKVRTEWADFRAPLNRYLAAKAFASWTAYQGRGVATIVRGLEAALALVRIEAARQCRDADRQLDETLLLEAFREADFILNHLAVGEDLATAWSSAELLTPSS